MKTILTVGEMQAGKTYFVVGEFLKQVADPDKLPFNLTHARNFNLVDLKNKCYTHPTMDEFEYDTNIVTLQDKTRFKNFLDLLTSQSEILDNTGFIGLNNAATHQKIASALINWHGYTSMFIDEYDTNQINFNRYRVPVKKDNSIRSYVMRDMLDELRIISATNMAAAISDYTFSRDEIVRIPRRPGYKGWGDYDVRIVDNAAIEALRAGEVRGAVCDIIEFAKGNVQINIDSSQEIHQRIVDGLKRVFQDQPIKFHVVNAESGFDLRTLDSGKHVIVGGLMFDRGVTFNRLSDLIIDKDAAKQPTLLQAVGRAFGYRESTPQIHANAEHHDQITQSFRIEQMLTDDVLALPVEERWKWLEQNVRTTDSIRGRVLPTKNRGWAESFQRNVSLNCPVARFNTLEQYHASGMDCTLLQTRVDGEEIPSPYKGNINYGRETVEKTISDFINKHPQDKQLHKINSNTGEQTRRYIIPPIKCTDGTYRWFDRETDSLTLHWYIDNTRINRDVSTPFVASYQHDGGIAVWNRIKPGDDQDGEGRIHAPNQ